MRAGNTDYQSNDNIVSSIVRVGSVTAVDNDKRLAQVLFQDLGLPSGWIPVMISHDYVPDYDVPQETEEAAGHKHEVKIKPWMPEVGDQVLCLYEPVRDGHGFVLGGVSTWQ